MKYPTPKRTVLKNGIRVITVPMPESPTVTAMVLVEAGSRYESPKDSGLSHFLEHMAFKGTTRRPSASMISKELETIGAQYNAFTGDEMTGYWAKARVKHFPEILDIVSDMYLDPLLPEKEIEKERGVIIEEINMYEDQPRDQVPDVLDKLMYGDQPAGQTILGPKENIKRFTRADFVRYRKLHYTGVKTAIIVAGGFTHAQMLKEVQEKFQHAPKGKRVERQKTIDTQKAPAFALKERKTDQTHFSIAFRGYSLGNDKRMVTLKLLATVLGKGMSSRLWIRLREEMGVCYYVGSGHSAKTDTGVFKISSGVDTKRVDEVMEVIIDELKKLRDEKIADGELAKAKEMWFGAIAMGLETSDEVADWYNDEILRQPLQTPAEAIRLIQSVTTDDIQKMAQDIFVPKKFNMALVGPKRDLNKLKRLVDL